MASLDTIIAALRLAAEDIHEAIARTRAAHRMAEEVRGLSERVGVRDVARRFTLVIDTVRRLEVILAEGAQRCEDATVQAEAIRGAGTAGAHAVGTIRTSTPGARFERIATLAELPARTPAREPGPRVTHGSGTYSDGTVRKFSSSNQLDKDLIRDTNDRLRLLGLLPGQANSARASDVEQKFAAGMRRDGARSAELVINNPDGPCTQRLGCDQILPYLLDPGQTMTVHWRDASGAWRHRTYAGR